jgi:hypothetical protein
VAPSVARSLAATDPPVRTVVMVSASCEPRPARLIQPTRFTFNFGDGGVAALLIRDDPANRVLETSGCPGARPGCADERGVPARPGMGAYLQGEDTLFKSRDERINFGNLLTIDADAAIDEKHVSLKAAAIAEA